MSRAASTAQRARFERVDGPVARAVENHRGYAELGAQCGDVERLVGCRDHAFRRCLRAANRVSVGIDKDAIVRPAEVGLFIGFELPFRQSDLRCARFRELGFDSLWLALR